MKYTTIPDSVRLFMPRHQQWTVQKNIKEFQNVIERLEKIIDEMPKTYETEDIEPDEIKVHLHYFYGSYDWYVIEKDMEPEQLQAYAYVNLGDHQNAEAGYLDIHNDILPSAKIELDFHFEPKLLNEVKVKR